MQKTTKKRWGIALAVLVALQASAWARPSGTGSISSRPEDERRTLIGGDFKTRWYVDLSTKIASLDDDTVILMGGGVGLTFNHAFSIGLAGWGKVNLDDYCRHSDSDVWIWDESFWTGGSTKDDLYGYGGLYLAYNLLPTKAVFGRVSLLLGAGGRDYCGVHDICRDLDWNHNVFWLIEPEVDLGVNVTSFMRLSLGVSYPIVDKKMSDLERIHVAFGLQVGK